MENTSCKIRGEVAWIKQVEGQMHYSTVIKEEIRDLM